MLLVAVTPLFFLLPDRQYGRPSLRWPAFAILVLWTIGVGIFAWRRTQKMREARAVAALDLIFAFALFVLTTRSSSGTAISYGSVVVVGSFQLQTYGPLITIGALSGLGAGLVAGASGAILYPVALAAIGRSAGGLFGPSQVASTISRSSLYVFVGLTFGLFHLLVRRLATDEQRAAEQTLKLLHKFHSRGLGKFGVILEVLHEMRDRARGELRDDLDGLAHGFDTILSGLRDITSDTEPGSKSIAQVLREVEANHGMPPLRMASRPVHLQLRDGLGEHFMLNPLETDHLEAIVSEAVGNAKKHARPGVITVSCDTRETRDFMIVVTDSGPAGHPGRGFHLGHDSIQEYVDEHGWSWEFELSQRKGGGSCLRVLIPLGSGSRPTA